MSIAAHRRIRDDSGVKARLPMRAPPLAALLYPFALKGFAPHPAGAYRTLRKPCAATIPNSARCGS
jgi:hypothetical protein